MKLRTALLASALTLTPLMSLAAPAQATPDTRYQIRISGTAQILAYPPVPANYPDYRRTELRIPITVRCPAGQTVHISFAGLPTFFPPPDNRAFPYLPAMSSPTPVNCTGKWVSAYAYALSIGRLQNPATMAFRRFTPGSHLVAQVALYGKPSVTDTKTVRVQREPLCLYPSGCAPLTP